MLGQPGREAANSVVVEFVRSLFDCFSNAFRSPTTGQRTPPSRASIHRILSALDPDALDAAVRDFLAQPPGRPRPGPDVHRRTARAWWRGRFDVEHIIYIKADNLIDFSTGTSLKLSRKKMNVRERTVISTGKCSVI